MGAPAPHPHRRRLPQRMPPAARRAGVKADWDSTSRQTRRLAAGRRGSQPAVARIHSTRVCVSQSAAREAQPPRLLSLPRLHLCVLSRLLPKCGQWVVRGSVAAGGGEVRHSSRPASSPSIQTISNGSLPHKRQTPARALLCSWSAPHPTPRPAPPPTASGENYQRPCDVLAAACTMRRARARPPARTARRGCSRVVTLCAPGAARARAPPPRLLAVGGGRQRPRRGARAAQAVRPQQW